MGDRWSELKYPELNYNDWKDTLQTLHLWTQIVGKVRLSKSPWVNHSWHSTLYVTERGLTTSIIHDGLKSFAIEFDFISHVLRVRRSDGDIAVIPLVAEPVAEFHRKCIGTLRDHGIEITISGIPNELAQVIPFSEDLIHRAYDSFYANRFWRVLLQGDRLMKEFRSHFTGKVSPVHFFWGSFDLAVTRFSGRRAPEHPGGVPHLPDLVARDAYSHEVSSCGFWPGNEQFPRAAFYSYAYPAPEGFERVHVPKGASYEPKLREFVLPYDEARKSSDPDALILDFFQKTYEAAAELGHWDRELLEETPYIKALRAKSAA